MNKDINLVKWKHSMRQVEYRHMGFLLFTFLIVATFYAPLKNFFSLLFANDLYSHITVIPFISGYSFYLQRGQIALEMKYSFKAGSLLWIIGALIFWAGIGAGLSLSQNDLFSIYMFSALVFWIGGFMAFYGVKAFKMALFPLLFLLFMIPVPDGVVDVLTSFLQRGSTEVVDGLFKIFGLPFIRKGFIFSLTDLTFEVAKQCSGIRSSLALFIISIFAGQLFLKTNWGRTILVLSVLPITIFKNGLRIFTVVMFGNYVDPRVMEGDLHRKGGILFLVLALVFMSPVFWALKRSEKKKRTG
jgi:exosortase